MLRIRLNLDGHLFRLADNLGFHIELGQTTKTNPFGSCLTDHRLRPKIPDMRESRGQMLTAQAVILPAGRCSHAGFGLGGVFGRGLLRNGKRANRSPAESTQ